MHLPVRAPRMAAPSCHMRVTEKCERRQGVFHYAVGASRCLHEGTVVEHISRQYWLRILSEDGRPETTQGYRRKTEEIHVALRRHLEKIYQHEVRVGAIDFRGEVLVADPGPPTVDGPRKRRQREVLDPLTSWTESDYQNISHRYFRDRNPWPSGPDRPLEALSTKGIKRRRVPAPQGERAGSASSPAAIRRPVQAASRPEPARKKGGARKPPPRKTSVDRGPRWRRPAKRAAATKNSYLSMMAKDARDARSIEDDAAAQRRIFVASSVCPKRNAPASRASDIEEGIDYAARIEEKVLPKLRQWDVPEEAINQCNLRVKRHRVRPTENGPIHIDWYYEANGVEFDSICELGRELGGIVPDNMRGNSGRQPRGCKLEN